jgi:hypothetical protein
MDVTLAGLRPRRQCPVADLDLRRLISVLHLVPVWPIAIAGLSGKDGAGPDRGNDRDLAR